MSEVNEKDLELQKKSLQDLFSDSQESLEEAQARKAKEEVSFVKAKYVFYLCHLNQIVEGMNIQFAKCY